MAFTRFLALTTAAVLATTTQALPTVTTKRDNTTTITQPSCNCSGPTQVAPFYTVLVPANLDVQNFGPGCPAQGFIDNCHGGGIELFNYGCNSFPDGSLNITFSSSILSDVTIDLALQEATDEKWPSSAGCNCFNS